jgi:hypothetical protein
MDANILGFVAVEVSAVHQNVVVMKIFSALTAQYSSYYFIW